MLFFPCSQYRPELKLLTTFIHALLSVKHRQGNNHKMAPPINVVDQNSFSLRALKIPIKGKWVILRNPRWSGSPIRWLTNAQVDFEKVAQDRQIRRVSNFRNNKPPSSLLTLDNHYSNHWRGLENSAKRYKRILKAQSESSTNASASGVPSTPPKTPPSKNGISKPTRKRATKTVFSAKMEKSVSNMKTFSTIRKSRIRFSLKTVARFRWAVKGNR